MIKPNKFDKQILHRIEEFDDYINSLHISPATKKFILAQPKTMYVAYADPFAATFNIKDDWLIGKLSTAFFLYCISVLQIDKIIDGQVLGSPQELFLNCTVCQEECIKILSEVFPLDSPFWKKWNDRRNELIQSIVSEKQNSLIIDLSLEYYEKLSENKASFGKAPIDAFHILSNYNFSIEYENLIHSHKWFYSGIQVLDDMEDLVEDFSETKQVNIAIAYLNKEMASQGRQLYDFKIENLEKILYLSGVAATLSDLAVQYFTNALDCVATHEKTYWNDIVDKNLQKAQNYRQIIEHHIGSM